MFFCLFVFSSDTEGLSEKWQKASDSGEENIWAILQRGVCGPLGGQPISGGARSSVLPESVGSEGWAPYFHSAFKVESRLQLPVVEFYLLQITLIWKYLQVIDSPYCNSKIGLQGTSLSADVLCLLRSRPLQAYPSVCQWDLTPAQEDRLVIVKSEYMGKRCL